MKFIINLLCLILLSVVSTFAITVDKINPTDYVTDYTNTLSQEQVLELSTKLGELERMKNIPVAVVMVPTMEDEFGREDYIEHFAVKLFEKLKIGNAKTDEGLLWLIVKDKREMRMEVGYGLESTYTDGITKTIQDNFVKPEFRNDNYFAGINNGIDKLIEVSSSEFVSIEQGSVLGKMSIEDMFGAAMFLFIIFINLLAWIVAILGRTKEWYLGGIIAFIIGLPILLFGFGLNILGNLTLFLFVLTGFIFDYFVSRNYKYWQHRLVDEGNKHGPDWWAGGTWAPGGESWRGRGSWTGRSGGSGFGGFGGGGMSGGGGSNSSW